MLGRITRAKNLEDSKEQKRSNEDLALRAHKMIKSKNALTKTQG